MILAAVCTTKKAPIQGYSKYQNSTGMTVTQATPAPKMGYYSR